jgi:chorismate mutase/prephenate dehydratase
MGKTMNEITENGVRRLKKWRSEIDRIDSTLLRLLSKRAAIACELGAVKIAYGLPAYDGGRERQVLARMRDANQGPLSGESVTRIFHRIILESRRIGIESMRQQRRKAMAVRRLGKEQRNGH